MRFAYAGDRAISVNILKFLISKGYKPAALFVSEENKATHSDELIETANIDEDYVFRGNTFKEESSLKKLKELKLDYVIGIHFPYIIPKDILDLPKIGVLNLHPAYLPYNKGWHTPSWAIIEGETYGATLHFMAEALDEGDIIHQKVLTVCPDDTANTLYQKALNLEEAVFYEAFDDLVSLTPNRQPQNDKGTSHFRKDLKGIQKIDLNKQYSGQEVIDKLRGLTTNSIEEAAYFEKDGKKIAIQIILKELNV